MIVRVLMIVRLLMIVRVRIRVGLRMLVVLSGSTVFGHGRTPGRLILTFTGVTESA